MLSKVAPAAQKKKKKKHRTVEPRAINLQLLIEQEAMRSAITLSREKGISNAVTI